MARLRLGLRLAAIRDSLKVTAFQAEDVSVHMDDLRAAAELRQLISHGPDEAYLMPRRMAALGIDADEVARIEPVVFRDMHARCTLCESHGRCAWDLADDIDEGGKGESDAWERYCPNVELMKSLYDMPWFRPDAPAR